MYRLILTKDGTAGKLEGYYKNTSLQDKRTLALAMPKKFNISDDDCQNVLLLYMLDKEKYYKIAKEKFEKIDKRINKERGKNGKQ
jgi:hypothetical protein